MARAPKLYSVRGLFVDRRIGQLLGLPDHVTQAEHYVMATTKAEAARILEAAGHRVIRPTNLHVAMGNMAMALAEAGVAVPGDVLVVRPLMFGPVVRIREGAAEIIGRTDRHPEKMFDTIFIPATPIPSPDHQEA